MRPSIYHILIYLVMLALLLPACAAAPAPTVTPSPLPPTETLAPPTKIPTATPPPVTRPVKDAGYYLVYHAGLERLILIGASYDRVDVWAYAVASQKLTRMKDKPAFNITSLAYNPQAGVIIANNSGTSGATWLFDPANDEWKEAASSHFYGENEFAGAGFDAESQKMIVLGGDVVIGLKETLIYDFPTDTWTLAKLDPNPPWIASLPGAYDAESDRILIWDGAVVKRMWVFDANAPAWEEVTYEGGPKVGCRTGAMAYAPDLDRTFLYCADLFYAYDYNTNQWEPAKGELKPGSREGLSMAYDSVNKKIVIYGGWGFDDLWLYDPQTGEWTQLGLE